MAATVPEPGDGGGSPDWFKYPGPEEWTPKEALQGRRMDTSFKSPVSRSEGMKRLSDLAMSKRKRRAR